MNYKIYKVEANGLNYFNYTTGYNINHAVRNLQYRRTPTDDFLKVVLADDKRIFFIKSMRCNDVKEVVEEINKLTKGLKGNINGRDKKVKIKQKREYKAECPYCKVIMNKYYLTRHIKRYHKYLRE